MYILALATVIAFYFGSLKAFHAIIFLKQKNFFLTTFVHHEGTPAVDAERSNLVSTKSILDHLQKPAALFNLITMGVGLPIAGAILVGIAMPRYFVAYIILCLPYYLFGVLIPRAHIADAKRSFLGSASDLVYVVIFKDRTFSQYGNMFLTWVPLVLFCVFIVLAVRR